MGEKIKKILKNKQNVMIIGILLVTLVVGFVGVSLINGEIKEMDQALSNNKVTASEKEKDSSKEDNKIEIEDKKENKDEITEIAVKEEVIEEMDKKSLTSYKDSDTNEHNNNKSKHFSDSVSNSSNTSSKDTSSSNSEPEPSKPEHTHSWSPIIEKVQHDELGHYEDVVVKEAWTEKVPVYDQKEVAICNGCGADITDDPDEHMKEALLSGNTACETYHRELKKVQVGTNTVNHPAITDTKWIVDTPAWIEEVVVGQSCSCGAKK